MAEPDALNTNGAASLEDALNRLSKKPGVQATLALDRASGAIIKTSGQLQMRNTPSSLDHLTKGSSGPNGIDDSTAQPSAVENMAAMVWAFVNAAGGLLQGIDAEDELKLLRLRTVKQEFVIVPDIKYLLVVIHEIAAP